VTARVRKTLTLKTLVSAAD